MNKEYLIYKKRYDLFYGPNYSGYTGIRDKAGRYALEDCPDDDELVAIHESEAPEFTKATYDDLIVNHLKEQMAELEDERDELKEIVQLIAQGGLYISPHIKEKIQRYMYGDTNDRRTDECQVSAS